MAHARALVLALLAAGIVSGAAGGATARTADTTLTPSFTRGDGTTLDITVTNNGPSAVRAVDNSGKVTGGFSLGLDQFSSGSTYMVVGAITAPKPWACSSQYDVVYCSKPQAFAAGESVKFSVPTNLCYPAGHAYQMYYFTNEGGNVGNASKGNFDGGGGDCSTTHIGALKVTVSNKVREQAASLKAQAADLDRQKQALESTLAEKSAALTKAEAALAAFDGKIAPIYAAVDETKSFLARIGKAEGNLTDKQKAELEARDSLDSIVVDLQNQIVAANQAGKTALAKSLQSRLNRDQARLDELNRSLRGSDAPLDALREKWLARLRVLNGQLFAALNGQALADQARVQAAKDLQDALDARTSLDNQLLALGARIFAIDVKVGDVTVNAGFGTPELVWKANVLGSTLDLDRIDQDLARLARAKDALAASEAVAADNFIAAEQASLAALENVSNTIMSTAYKKAAVDFVFNLWDVIKAGKKGGLIGASAETLKKAVETLTKEYVVERGAGRWGSKGAVEFDNDLAKNISNAMLEKAGLKTLGERVVKETVTKKGKDALNKSIGTLVFEKVYGTVPSLYQQAAEKLVAAGNPSVELIEELQAAADARAKQFSSLSGLSSSTKWEKLGDLGTTLLKDAAKTALKTHFDVQEQQAWIAYYEAEITAQMYFPLWQATATAYWKAYDAYNQELEQEAKVLAGYDPTGHFKVALDKHFFANDPISINFGATGGDGTTAVTVEVLVDGRKAEAFSGASWAIPDPHFKVTAKGLLLEIRVT